MALISPFGPSQQVSVMTTLSGWIDCGNYHNKLITLRSDDDPLTGPSINYYLDVSQDAGRSVDGGQYSISGNKIVVAPGACCTLSVDRDMRRYFRIRAETDGPSHPAALASFQIEGSK